MYDARARNDENAQHASGDSPPSYPCVPQTGAPLSLLSRAKVFRGVCAVER